ncbi:MAG: LysE family translocator [Candidatus Rokuibacteriota bacterium]
MTLQTWLVFCATELALSFTPGPAVLLVASTALTLGGRAGIAASFGVLAANTAYFALSATGLGAVLVASWSLFHLIKWIGAAYLVWLGLRMVLAPKRPPAPDGRPSGPPADCRAQVAFWRGFTAQGANPKALLFFTALLPQFVDPEAGVPAQVLVLGVSSVVIELTALSVYVAACRVSRRWVQAPGVASLFQRIGGLMLVGAGAQLAAVRRP